VIEQRVTDRAQGIEPSPGFDGSPGHEFPPTPSIVLKVVCSYCKRVLFEGTPGAAVSHGLGRCCWDRARAAAGLPPKPFPGRRAA
jgi:hypothetical protein